MHIPRRKARRRPPVVLICGVGLLIAICAALLIVQGSVTSNSMPFVSSSAASIQKSPAQRPARLSIPSIGVNAVVAAAGLTPSGNMDIKKNPDQVAWYEFGPRPGDEGSAVIAGHYGWTGLHGSVFNNLHKLKKGDIVSVIGTGGATTNFVVMRMQLYDPAANATAIFQSSDGKAHLNLITCDGVWVSAKNSDSQRLVVFTDRE